jgi:hypothetical protein
MAEVPAPKPAAAIPEIPATSAPAPMPSHAWESAKGSEVPWYALALLLGAISGFAEVAVGDLMLTGFMALFFCMVMGALRPGRPWRWVLIVCGCIPLARLFAAGVMHMYTERAQIYEAFLSFITGNAGAYVGSLGRKRANDLFEMIRTGKR